MDLTSDKGLVGLLREAKPFSACKDGPPDGLLKLQVSVSPASKSQW
jgi:hypothetical protein